MMVTTTTPLFLSRLLLNPLSRQVMSEMAHPYEMHRTLMRAFPRTISDTQSRARNQFGVLFRAEVDDLRGVVKIYIQSNIEPDWSFLDVLHDYLCTNSEMPGYEYKDIMPAFRKIRVGQIFSFHLRANPTKRIAKDSDPMKGKRVELQREEEQVAWLIRKGQEREKGEPGGFDLLMKKVKDVKGEVLIVPRVNVCSEGKQKGRKRDAGGGHATTHQAVLFGGLLRVTDKNAFLGTLVRGIGTGKAFGFGLLSVAPVNTSGSDEAT